MNLSFIPISLDKFKEDIKKYGFWKTILIYVLFFYLPIFVLFFIQYFNNKDFKKELIEINNKISQNQEQKQEQKLNQSLVLGDNSSEKEIKKEEQNLTNFNPDNWVIDKFKKEDDFYCPNNVKGYDFWSMWTKEQYPVKMDKIKIKFQIKQINKEIPPTVTLSYGTYFGNIKSPEEIYRINIFDDGPKSIRLYKNNKSSDQSYLEKEVDLNSEITFEISPRILDSKGRTIKINPTLRYAVLNSEEQEEHITKKDFEVVLPMVDIEDSSTKKQFGIGTRNGNCIKILSFEPIL